MKNAKNRGIYILSLQAKDVFNANNLLADIEKKNKGKKITGYNTKNTNGRGFNTKRYINSFDYSIDLVKIKELCEEQNIKYSFKSNLPNDKKHYTNVVINIDFDYNVKVFNLCGNIYSAFGYEFTYKDFKNVKIKISDDKYCDILDSGVKLDDDGYLIGITLNKKVNNPVSADILGKYFCYDEKYQCYRRTKTDIPTLILVNGDTKFKCDCVQLREYLYNNGFYVNGKRYVRYKRSAGSSRVGKCLFVDVRLYEKLHEFDLCGLTVNKDDEIDLAAFESYIALTNSSNIDNIIIKKENILIIDDYESVFTDKIMAVWSNDNEELEADKKEIPIKNNIWDGQSLIDCSLMGENYKNNGMILLRNRFFKSCCFNTKLQHFFAKNGITDIKQLNGFTLAENIEDIKLITTPSSLKYLKFGSIEKWFENYIESYGIVKHEKPTPYFDGNLVQISYQMFNCLQADKAFVRAFLQPTIDFMKQLRDSHLAVKYFINFKDEDVSTEDIIADEDNNANENKNDDDNISSKNDLIFKLLDINCDFHKSKLFHEFKRDLIYSFVKKVKRGNVLVKGTYATVCSNPIEMLYHSILENNNKSRFENIGFTSLIGLNNIYCKKYEFNKTVFAARNPFICAGNCWLPFNKNNDLIYEYMNPTNEIVYINSIGENVLQRNNGMDMDSDQIAVLNEDSIVELVQKNYNKFLVPTSLVEGKKTKRKYNMYELAELDSKTAINKIGEIVNLSQQLNSELWERLNNDPNCNYEELYKDICKLAVLSGLEIDSAKKEFPINTASELEKIRKKLYDMYKDKIDAYNTDIDKHNEEIDRINERLKDDSAKLPHKKRITSIKPKFMRTITINNGYTPNENTKYIEFDTAMDYLQEQISKIYYGFMNVGDRKKLKMKDLIIDDEYDNDEERRHKINSIIESINETKTNIGKVWRNGSLNKSSKRGLVKWHRNNLLEGIIKTELNKSTIIGLLRRSDIIGDKNCLLLQTLLDIPDINILQYFTRKDEGKTESEKLTEWNEKISELFSIYHLTNEKSML